MTQCSRNKENFEIEKYIFVKVILFVFLNV